MRDRALAKLYPVISHSSLLCVFLPSCPAAEHWLALPGAQHPCLGQAGLAPTAAAFLLAKQTSCFLFILFYFIIALLLTAWNASVSGGNALLNAGSRWVALPCYISPKASWKFLCQVTSFWLLELILLRQTSMSAVLLIISPLVCTFWGQMHFRSALKWGLPACFSSPAS